MKEWEDENVSEEKDELYEHFNFTVDKGQELLRIDKYLQGHIPNITRNKIQQAAKAMCIVVNKQAVKQNYRVKPNDIISVLMPHPKREFTMEAEDIPLEVPYEDNDIIIINKPPNFVVHPAHGNYTGTLVNALLHRFEGQTHADGQTVAPYLVHRIDKNTSGIMVVAKSEEAQMGLAKSFFDHTIDRKYWALVWGDFDEDEGTIEANIGRHPKDRTVMTTFPPDEELGKHAITHWKVVERFGYVTLIECVLETGRTHQIRAHLKSIGHPLFNDETYGGNRVLKGTTFSKYKQFVFNCFDMLPRQALHAKELGFIHPVTKERVHFNAELPENFQAVLTKWRNYSSIKIAQDE